MTIATEAAYEPWNMTLPGGAIGGFEPELIADLCNRIKLHCKLQAQDWDGMIAGLQVGKFDMLMDAIMITPERQQVIAFSAPYAVTPGVLVAADKGLIAAAGPSGQVVKLTGDAAHDKPTVDAMRALLKGKSIGIASGTAYTQFIQANFSDIATVREYKKSGEHVMDLVAGRIDYAFDDVTFFSSIMDKPENQSLAIVGPKIGGSIWGPGEALAFRQSDPELKARFDDALRSALADGTVKTLSHKWFKTDITP
ncbi:transporter substrate-binding domain-containing protein [Pseudomonas sp. NA-150]|uniref:transporter substrate-binding domain-containing protein n=1 Tax=Pseudomonas sp. NA-150 TaxID=3367525 RepID=UPI0037CB7BA7